MVREITEIVRGYFVWTAWRLWENLDYKSVVLVLTGENEKVDDYAIKYLNDLIAWKSAAFALVVGESQEQIRAVSDYPFDYPVKTKVVSAKKIRQIYRLYCVYRFFENIIFTYVRTTKDNLLETYMKETDIDEEDVVCLALYKLRRVPGKTAKE